MVREDEEPVEQPVQDNEADDQCRYPNRHRTVPVRYGIDEYVDTAFFGWRSNGGTTKHGGSIGK